MKEDENVALASKGPSQGKGKQKMKKEKKKKKVKCFRCGDFGY